MRFGEFILHEGISHVFGNKDSWIAAAIKLGAAYSVKSPDQHKIIAVSDVKKPAIKSFGEWDEKTKEGWVYDLRKKIRGIEILPDTAKPLTESEVPTEEDEAEGDLSDSVPFGKTQEIRKLIKKGAMDPDHNWSNALDLVHRAYEVAEVERPTPSMHDAWPQYEDLILYAVEMLQKATIKGMRDDSWKSQSLS